MASDEIEEITIRDYSKNDSRRSIDYKVIRTLGEGGFGKVLHVKRVKFDLKEGKEIEVEYALKTMPKRDIVNDKKLKHRVITEIKIHRQLQHENICKFDHSFDDKNNVNIVIEYCPNSTLQELLRFRSQITEFEVRYYMFQVLQALIYLKRQKIIHRDVTLCNIFLSKGNIVKVGDFGLSFKETCEEDKKGKACGTEPYLAPELTGVLVTYSYKTDIWAFGVCIYELLTGRRLFENPDHAKELLDSNPLSRGPRISDEAKDLLSRIFVKDIERIELGEINSHVFFNKGLHLNVGMPTYSKESEKEFFNELEEYKKKIKITYTKEILTLGRRDPKGEDIIGIQLPNKSNSNNTLLAQQPSIKRASLIVFNTQEETDSKLNKYSKEHLQTEAFPNNEINPILRNIEANYNYARSNKRMSTITCIQPKNTDSLKKRLDLKIETKIDTTFKFRTLNKDSSSSLLNRHLFKDFSPQITEENKETINYDTIAITHLDKSSRFGIGYRLNNGMYGVYFNDGVKLLSNNKELYLWNKESSHQCSTIPISSLETAEIEAESAVASQHHHEIMRRYNIMIIFIEELTKKRKNELIDKELLDHEGLVYLMKWKRTRSALFFLLSNKNIQVNFFDKTIIVFHYRNKVIRYHNEEDKVKQFYADPITSVKSDNQEIQYKIFYSIQEFLKDT